MRLSAVGHVRLRHRAVRAESGLRQRDLDGGRSFELVAVLGIESHAKFQVSGGWRSLPRQLEAVAESAERLLPGGTSLRRVECPESEPLLLRGLGQIKQLAFHAAGHLNRLLATVNRSEDERDLVVARSAVAVEPTGQQRVDFQTGDLEMLFVQVEHFVVAGRLYDLLRERFIQTPRRGEFGIRPIDLRVQRPELVFLLSQPGFEQIDIAPARAARSGDDGQRQQSISEPHP